MSKTFTIHESIMQGKVQILFILCFALLLRWCITYHPHSGQGKPPMFGDYEAQRHWQEITLNLPAELWYTNSTDNDLLYWGLDYPPLTAYHSLLLGHIANRINPLYVRLHESRGISSDDHKYFMRLTVLCADAVIYVPAIMCFIRSLRKLGDNRFNGHNIFGFTKRDYLLITALIYPGLILIDHGHFQYNCVSLGLFIAAVAAIMQDSLVIGSFLFVLALNYKQMELYHALPFFFYIFGSQMFTKNKSWISSVYTLICVSLTVISTFFIIWLPFLKDWNTLKNVIHRLFPFARGVFEDKVANVWCAINVLYKLRDTLTNNQLAQTCLIVTSLAVLPSCIDLCLRPNKEKFLISFINSALAFFLFSYQVHEKSILLVAIPVLLYFHNDPFPCFWFLLTSHFSMLPLYIKDDLYIAYIATTIFYFLSVLWMWFDCDKILDNNKHKSSRGKPSVYSKSRIKQSYNKLSVFAKIQFKSKQIYEKCLIRISSSNFNKSLWAWRLFYISITNMLLLSITSKIFKPPERYPDLFAVLISIYSCGHFILFYLYFNYIQLFHTKIHNNSKNQ